MRRILPLSLLLVAGLAAADDKKGTPVDLDGMTSTTPADWVKETPKGTMRKGQFKIPRHKDDKYDAELVLFRGIGGSADDNVGRWKGQFKNAKSKVTKVQIAGLEATQLDIEGTCLYNPNPSDFKAKPEPREDYRMLAIHFEGPKEVYHIKLTGPAKTVEQAKKGFDEWLKGYKK